MDSVNIARFYKEVGEIQTMHEDEIIGKLTDYFEYPEEGSYPPLVWRKNPGNYIRNKVIIAGYEFLENYDQLVNM